MSKEAPGALIAFRADQGGLQVGNINELKAYARLMHEAGFAPNCKDEREALGRIVWGTAAGLTLPASLRYVAMINDMPTIWGDGLRGRVLGCGLLANVHESVTGAGESRTAVCQLWRKGIETPFVGSFSLADAKRAGLAGRQTYQKFLDDMLARRAFGRAASKGFADILVGMVPEGAEDLEATGAAVTVIEPEPSNASRVQEILERQQKRANEAGEKAAEAEEPSEVGIDWIDQQDEAAQPEVPQEEPVEDDDPFGEKVEPPPPKNPGELSEIEYEERRRQDLLQAIRRLSNDHGRTESDHKDFCKAAGMRPKTPLTMATREQLEKYRDALKKKAGLVV